MRSTSRAVRLAGLLGVLSTASCSATAPTPRSPTGMV
ncbi:hypothetical protein J2X46_003885 [Nocardioides sp. BE266]|nr:hypothetical protein [Nocardioides sp. BE266]